MAKRIFDINDHSKEKLASPATWNQCSGLGRKLQGTKNGKPDYAQASRIAACLASEADKGKFTFLQAHKLFQKKTLPKKYQTAIRDYLAQQPE